MLNPTGRFALVGSRAQGFRAKPRGYHYPSASGFLTKSLRSGVPAPIPEPTRLFMRKVLRPAKRILLSHRFRISDEILAQWGTRPNNKARTCWFGP